MVTPEVILREVVVVNDERVSAEWHGTWFPPDFDFETASGPFMEMVAGRAVVANVTQDEARKQLSMRHATDDQWAFVIGLVVCDMAKRVQF